MTDTKNQQDNTKTNSYKSQKTVNPKPVRKNKKSTELSSKTEVETAFKFLAGD